MSKAKVSMTAADISNKWNKNFKNGIPNAVAGVQRITENPMDKAALAKEKMRANLNAAIDDGRWEAGLRKVNLANWQNITATKLKERGASGADAAMTKRQAFDTWIVNTLNGILPEISGMSDLTLEDSKARMIRIVDYMAEHKYKTS